MVRRRVALFLVLCFYIGFSISQETHGSPAYNSSNHSFRLNNRAPVDYNVENSNLWLLSRGDPIPAGLNQHALVGDSVSTRLIGSAGNNYGLRIPSRSSSVNTQDIPISRQSPISYASQSPLYYDRIVTTDNRREYLDSDAQTHSQDTPTILVELPPDITEGLWVRPESPILPQHPSLDGRQNMAGESVNNEFDDLDSGRQDSLSPNFVPNRELSSRLPNNDFSPQGSFDIPQEQYYELPYPIISTLLQGVNISTDSLNYPDSKNQEISQKHNHQNSIDQDRNLTTGGDYLAIGNSERARNIHEYEVLTNEDIELLERLGILSALIIEPTQPNDEMFTPAENSLREFESEPVLIDHGGQSYLTTVARQDTSNHRDVVLIDVPQFTNSEYHASLPENSATQEHNQSLEAPNSESGPKTNKLNDSSQSANYSNLTDRQILEILQLFSLSTEDIANLSTAAPTTQYIQATTASGRNSISDNITEHFSNITTTSNSTSKSFASLPPSITSSDSSIDSAQLIKIQASTAGQTVDAPPSESTGRIQPRLLNKLTKSDNEIIEGLFENVNRMSQSKLEILKKLQNQPKPYIFGYKQDDGNGTLQHRDEKADSSGVVKGTYGYRDALGVYRNVSYIADKNGFHAVVKTNEPGTVSHNTADVVYKSQTPPLAALVKMMNYRKPNEVVSVGQFP